jgi:hypothetical protein
MQTLVSIQHWLYGGMGKGLGDVVGGVLAAGLLVTAAMTVGMIGAIGGIALAAALARNRFMKLLARTERLRLGIGLALEVGGSLAVLGFGLWTLARS